MTKGPMQRYQSLIASGALKPDDRQLAAMQKLQNLEQALVGYAPEKKSFFVKAQKRPRGLYLWGGVGRGKSLLMDMFFNNSSVAKKQRIHFHEFIIGVHTKKTAWEKLDSAARRAHPFFVRDADEHDPIPPIAKEIFSTAHLLCFDEFQVSDIANAMLLMHLFKALIERGCVIVATSNRMPDELYKDGLNRELFLPAIASIKQSMDIFHLDSPRDFRRDQLVSAPVYYSPLGDAARTAMDSAWQRLICGGAEVAMKFNVKGRQVVIPRTARGIGRVSFDQLCGVALGAEDYLAIASNFHTLFMDDIPLLTPELRNEAKRFVTLIDALYERRVKFVCSADQEPAALYPNGHGAFEFQRTVSRLFEMSGDAYLHAALREAV